MTIKKHMIKGNMGCRHSALEKRMDFNKRINELAGVLWERKKEAKEIKVPMEEGRRGLDKILILLNKNKRKVKEK